MPKFNAAERTQLSKGSSLHGQTSTSQLFTTTKEITVCWEQTRERSVCHKHSTEERKVTCSDKTREKNKTESDII